MVKLSKTRPTLGLEIEFLVPWKLDKSIQAPFVASGVVHIPFNNEARVDQEIAAMTYTYDCLCKSIVAAGNKAGTQEAWSLSPEAARQLWRESWIVKRDASVFEDDSGIYDGYTDVEFNTPIYNAPPDDNKNAQKWKRITRTMQKLQEDWPRIHINKRCAYQVHVGLPSGYDLLNVKKLATVLWLAETRLSELYSPERRRECQWYRPLAKYSRLAIANPVERKLAPNPSVNNAHVSFNRQLDEDILAGNYNTGANMSDYETWVGTGTFGERAVENYRPGPPLWEAWIGSPAESSRKQPSMVNAPKLEAKMVDLWKAESGTQLCFMLAPKPSPEQPTRLAYNFNNVFGVKGTVEFRQMESTLDPVHLRNWAIVCYKLVIFAKKSDVPKFKNMLQCLLYDKDQYDIWSLLRDIKCRESVMEWFKAKIAET